MKTIRIPQPYASMISKGLIKYLPSDIKVPLIPMETVYIASNDIIIPYSELPDEIKCVFIRNSSYDMEEGSYALPGLEYLKTNKALCKAVVRKDEKGIKYLDSVKEIDSSFDLFINTDNHLVDFNIKTGRCKEYNRLKDVLKYTLFIIGVAFIILLATYFFFVVIAVIIAIPLFYNFLKKGKF